MNIGIPKTTQLGETSVATTREVDKRIRAKGLAILSEESSSIDSRR